MHIASGTGVLQQILTWKFKNLPDIQPMSANNSGAKGPHEFFPRDVPRAKDESFGTTFGGPHPRNFVGQNKHTKLRRDFGQL